MKKSTLLLFILFSIAFTSVVAQNATYQIQKCEKNIVSLDKKLTREIWNTTTQLIYSKESLNMLRTNIDALKKKDPSYDMTEFEDNYDMFNERIESAKEGVPNNYYSKKDTAVSAILSLNPEINSKTSSGSSSELSNNGAYWDLKLFFVLYPTADEDVRSQKLESRNGREDFVKLLLKMESLILMIEEKDPDFNTSEYRTVLLTLRENYEYVTAPLKAMDANYYGQHTYIIGAIFKDNSTTPNIVTNEVGPGRHYSSYYYTGGIKTPRNNFGERNPVLLTVNKCSQTNGSIETVMTLGFPMGVDTTATLPVNYTRVTPHAPNFYIIDNKVTEKQLATTYKYCVYMDNGDLVFFDLKDYINYELHGFVLFSRTKARVRSSETEDINVSEIEKQVNAALETMKKACTPKNEIHFSNGTETDKVFKDGDRITARLKTADLLAEDFKSGKPLIELRKKAGATSHHTSFSENISVSGNELVIDVFPSIAPAGSKNEGDDLKGHLFDNMNTLLHGENVFTVSIKDERGCPSENGVHYYGKFTIKSDAPKSELKFPKYGTQYAESVEKYSTAKLPEPATRDAALEQAILSGVNPIGGKVIKVILRSVDWSIMRNTRGDILYRYRPITFCSNQPEGYCAFETYDISQQYNGDGYSKNLQIKGSTYSGGLQGIQCAKIK